MTILSGYRSIARTPLARDSEVEEEDVWSWEERRLSGKMHMTMLKDGSIFVLILLGFLTLNI